MLAPIKAIFNILLVVAKNFLICEALIINKVKTPQENIGCIEPCACDIWGVTDTLPKPSGGTHANFSNKCYVITKAVKQVKWLLKHL